MPTYTYRAANRNGKITRGSMSARDERTLERILEQEGAHLIRILKTNERKKSSGLKRKLSSTDQIEMAYHLSVMCTAGVPLISALEDFTDRRASPRLKRVLEQVVLDVNGGLLLSEALARHPGSFNRIFINLVEAGEASGSLDLVMERFYKELEWQSRIKARLIQALAYPSFLILALAGLVTLLLTFLLPKVLNMLPGGDASIPLPTRILMESSRFLQAHWIWMVVVLGALPLFWKAVRWTQEGRFVTDKFLTMLPVVGGVVLDVTVARFISTLRTLLVSGVEIVQALEISGGASGSAVIKRRADAITEEIRNGALLSEAFRNVKEFNTMIHCMIDMSEKTGQITQVLERVTTYFDTTIPRKVKRMIAVMEPTIICMAGVIVGFVLVGTLLPLFNLYSSV